VSRIYDAIKRAQSERDASGKPSGNPEFDRRRAKRIDMRVPLYVYGHDLRHEPFHLEGTSLVVNSHGALLKLSSRVKPGQELLLTNCESQLEQSCRVVRLVRKDRKNVEVAVAFAEPAPAFWPIPPDQSPPAEKQD
jgi:hypothetical protein